MELQPGRHIDGPAVVSDRMPAVRIDVATDFAYAGRLRFVLNGVARVESFVFAAADDPRAGRLLVVQFEGYLEGNDHVYDYPFTETVTLGNEPFHADAAVVDLAPPPPPDSDMGRVLALLEAQGHALPARAAVQRFVYLPDEAKRNELIILYAEGLDGGAESAPWEEVARAMRERVLGSVTVRFPDGGGTPAERDRP